MLVFALLVHSFPTCEMGIIVISQRDDAADASTLQLPHLGGHSKGEICPSVNTTF